MITERMQQLAGVTLNEELEELQTPEEIKKKLKPYVDKVKSTLGVKRVEYWEDLREDSLVGFKIETKDHNIPVVILSDSIYGDFQPASARHTGTTKYVGVYARAVGTDISKPEYLDLFFAKIKDAIKRGIIPETGRNETSSSSLDRKIGISKRY